MSHNTNKVCIFSAFIPNTPGGVPSVIQDITKYYTNCGINHMYVYSPDSSSHVPLCIDAYASNEFSKGRRLWRELGTNNNSCLKTALLHLDDAARMLAKSLNGKNISLVHSHTDWYLADKMASYLGVPHVATLHGFIPYDQDLIDGGKLRIPYSNILRQLIVEMNCSWYTCVSKYTYDLWVESGMDQSRSSVIRNAINFSRYRMDRNTKLMHDLNIPENKKNICFPQRPDKPGTTWLLKLLVAFLESHLDTFLVICVGNGNLSESQLEILRPIKKQMSAYNFTREEMITVYNSSYLTVLPSPIEPVGLPSFESLGCGTPILAPNSGGYKENFSDGVQGAYLYEPYSANEFWTLLSKILEGKRCQKNLVTSKMVNKFAIQQIAQEYVDIYEKSMNKQFVLNYSH